MNPSKKRSILLINPNFQIRFMGWMVAIVILVLGSMQIAHLWFFFRLRRLAGEAGLSPNHVLFQFINDRQAELNVISGITFLVIFTLVISIGLILSHRIAGPLYRLKKHLESVSATNAPTPVSFRKGDYFQEVAEAYNLQIKNSE